LPLILGKAILPRYPEVLGWSIYISAISAKSAKAVLYLSEHLGRTHHVAKWFFR